MLNKILFILSVLSICYGGELLKNSSLESISARVSPEDIKVELIKKFESSDKKTFQIFERYGNSNSYNFSDGIMGNALDLNGERILAYPASKSIISSKAGSISLWFKFDIWHHYSHIFSISGDKSNSNIFRIFFTVYNNLYFNFKNSNDQVIQVPNKVKLLKNIWHNVIFSWEGMNYSFWVNGVKKMGKLKFPMSDGYEFVLGNSKSGARRMHFDELRIENKALSDEECLSIYRDRKSYKVNSNTTLYASFDKKIEAIGSLEANILPSFFIRTGQDSNIYRKRKGAELSLLFVNPTSKTLKNTKLEVNLFDINMKRIKHQSISFSILKNAFKKMLLRINLPVLGIYTVNLKFINNGNLINAKRIRFGICNAPERKDINFDSFTLGLNRTTTQNWPGAGMPATRLFGYPWNSLETVKGEYDFRALDNVVNSGAKENIRMILIIYGSPSWAARYPSKKTQKRRFLNLNDMSPPKKEFYPNLSKLCEEIAKRYKDKIWYYEAWNEAYWGPHDFFFGTAKEYATVASYINKGLKRGYNKSKLLIAMGGSENWMRTVAKNSYKFLDGISVHPYGAGDHGLDYVHEIKLIKGLLKSAGRKTPYPIIGTEEGCVDPPLNKLGVPMNEKESKGFKFPIGKVYSEIHNAEQQYRNNFLSEYLGLSHNSYYFVHRYGFGTIHQDNSPKIKLMTLASISNLLNNSYFFKRYEIGNPRIFFLQFKKDNESILAIWDDDKSSKEKQNIFLNLPQSAVKVDLFGNKTPIKKNGAFYKIAVKNNPLIIRHIPKDYLFMGYPVKLSGPKKLSPGKEKELSIHLLNPTGDRVSVELSIKADKGINISENSIDSIDLGANERKTISIKLSPILGAFGKKKISVLSNFSNSEIGSFKTYFKGISIAASGKTFYSQNEIEIDGDLSEYQKYPPLYNDNVDHLVQGIADGPNEVNATWFGIDDLSGKAWTLYDDKYFYFAVKVQDDILRPTLQAPSKAFYNGDGIEMFIDPLLSNKRNTYQFYFVPPDINRGEYSQFSYGVRKPNGTPDVHIDASYKKLANGYIVESRILLEDLNLSSKNLKRIAFDYSINDCDSASGEKVKRDTEFSWSAKGKAFLGMQNMGQLAFVDIKNQEKDSLYQIIAPIVKSKHIKLVEGKFGQGFLFSKDWKAYLKYKNFLHNKGTIAFWVKLNEIRTYPTFFKIKQKGVNAIGLTMNKKMDENGLILMVYSEKVKNKKEMLRKWFLFPKTKKGFIKKNKWIHIAITLSEDNYIIYINGKRIVGIIPDAKKYSMKKLGNEIFFGSQEFGRGINAIMDEIVIFKDALNAENVEKLFLRKRSLKFKYGMSFLLNGENGFNAECVVE